MAEFNRCPTCLKEGKQSKLHLKDGGSEQKPPEVFFDEAGIKHVHDHSVYRTIYTCSNGHTNTLYNYGHCIACGWSGEKP